MKKQTISIIALLVVGTLFGVGYSASTVISDSGITTTNLTITGTCTGCGSGSFINWTTSLNETIAGTGGHPNAGLFVSIDGSVSSTDTTSKTALILINGTVKTVTAGVPNMLNVGQLPYAQSIDGKYKVFLTASGVDVYKNNVLIKTLGIDKTQFTAGVLGDESVGISSDGKYIAVSGEDSGAAIERVLIFGGS